MNVKKLVINTTIILIITSSLTGCSLSFKIPFLEKEEESTESRYVIDEEYAKKMDEYVSLADATVKTDFGNVAIMKLPNRMRDFNADHINNSILLKETKYLAEYTEDKSNTDPAYMIHYSYAQDVGNLESLCESFVLQTADIPQSILFDNGNTLHNIYKATEVPCNIKVSYLDETTEDVKKFEISENDSSAGEKTDSHFATVYVFPYNGCYIFCECYAYNDRSIDTTFYNVTQAALKDINEKNWRKAFNESIAKRKEEEFGNKDKPTTADCEKKMEDLFNETVLAVKETDEQREKREKKESSSDEYISDTLAYIPGYKPEHKLLVPDDEYLKLNLKRDNYNVKHLEKKEKSKKFVQYLQWQSKDFPESKAQLIQVSKKYKKKYYGQLVKKLEDETLGYDLYSKKGQNFEVHYGISKQDNRMWAVYKFDDRILYFTGNITSVVKNMNMIRFSYDEYKYKYYREKD